MKEISCVHSFPRAVTRGSPMSVIWMKKLLEKDVESQFEKMTIRTCREIKQCMGSLICPGTTSVQRGKVHALFSCMSISRDRIFLIYIYAPIFARWENVLYLKLKCLIILRDFIGYFPYEKVGCWGFFLLLYLLLYFSTFNYFPMNFSKCSSGKHALRSVTGKRSYYDCTRSHKILRDVCRKML